MTATALTKSWDAAPGVSREIIDDTQQQIGYALPDDLIDFMRQRNGGEGYLGPADDNAAWIRINPLEDWPSLTDSYGFGVDKLVMIGTDGGAFAYCVSHKSLPMEYREVDFVAGGQGRYLGDSFEEFLNNLAAGAKPKQPKRATKVKPKPLPAPPKDKPLRELKGMPEIVFAMSISPDGTQLAVSALGNGAGVFDLATGKAVPVAKMGEDDFPEPAVGWVNGRPVVLRQGNLPTKEGQPTTYQFRVIDLLDGSVLSAWQHQDSFGSGGRGEFSPDGTRLVFFAPHTTQLLVDPTKGKRIKDLPGASNHPFAIAWSADSKLLALGRRSTITPVDYAGPQNMMPPQPDWQVLLLDRDGNEVGQLKLDPPPADLDPSYVEARKSNPNVRGVAFDPAGGRLMVVRATDVRIFPLKGTQPAAEPAITLKVPLRTIEAATFVGDGRAAVTTAEGQVLLYDLSSPARPIRQWQTQKLQLRLLRATPDGGHLLTANGQETYSSAQAESKTVRVWKIDV